MTKIGPHFETEQSRLNPLVFFSCCLPDCWGLSLCPPWLSARRDLWIKVTHVCGGAKKPTSGGSASPIGIPVFFRNNQTASTICALVGTRVLQPKHPPSRHSTRLFGSRSRLALATNSEPQDYAQLGTHTHTKLAQEPDAAPTADHGWFATDSQAPKGCSVEQKANTTNKHRWKPAFFRLYISIFLSLHSLFPLSFRRFLAELVLAHPVLPKFRLPLLYLLPPPPSSVPMRLCLSGSKKGGPTLVSGNCR